MILDDIKKSLELIKKEGVYPDVFTISGPSTTTEVNVNGRDATIFCSNNYLGLATDQRVKEATLAGVQTFGLGSGGSRLVSGNISVQRDLEYAIARFKGEADAITFVTGYMANTGVIPALVRNLPTSKFQFLLKQFVPHDRVGIFSDELNHASIVDGCIIAKADRIVYKHRNTDDLEEQLRSRGEYQKKLIITDGVFSMDGDIAALDKIVELAEKYDALVMVDDAHATGVLGPNGKGTADHFGIKSKHLITMGTFTKVFGGIGGFVVGDAYLMDYLRVTARTYVFTAPVPPAVALGITKAIEIVANEPERREKLMQNVAHLRTRLNEIGCNTLSSETQILPVLIGDEKKATLVSRKMLERGYFVPCVRWPAVAHGEARLRVTTMTPHEKKHIDGFVDALAEVKNEVHF